MAVSVDLAKSLDKAYEGKALKEILDASPACPSEGLFAEVHHREVDGLDDLAFGGQPRQHVLREKVCRGDLSGIERAVAVGDVAVERVEGDLGVDCSSSQPINRSPTASRNGTDSSPTRYNSRAFSWEPIR